MRAIYDILVGPLKLEDVKMSSSPTIEEVCEVVKEVIPEISHKFLPPAIYAKRKGQPELHLFSTYRVLRRLGLVDLGIKVDDVTITPQKDLDTLGFA